MQFVFIQTPEISLHFSHQFRCGDGFMRRCIRQSRFWLEFRGKFGRKNELKFGLCTICLREYDYFFLMAQWCLFERAVSNFGSTIAGSRDVMNIECSLHYPTGETFSNSAGSTFFANTAPKILTPAQLCLFWCSEPWQNIIFISKQYPVLVAAYGECSLG